MSEVKEVHLVKKEDGSCYLIDKQEYDKLLETNSGNYEIVLRKKQTGATDT